MIVLDLQLKKLTSKIKKLLLSFYHKFILSERLLIKFCMIYFNGLYYTNEGWIFIIDMSFLLFGSIVVESSRLT